MTVDDVLKRVEQVRAVAGDDEAAHSAEDELHQDVLEVIAEGHTESAALARAALTTKTIEFERWCA